MTFHFPDRQVTTKDEFGGSKAVVKCVFVLFFSSYSSSVQVVALCVSETDTNFNFTRRPFIIDLESTNGTHVNDEAIPTTRYYELKSGDGKRSGLVCLLSIAPDGHCFSVIKFGQSTREYVLLNDADAMDGQKK